MIPKAYRRLRAARASFARAREGAAGIEFAFVLPVLLVVAAASIDLSEALQANRKTNNVASSVASFVADQNQWTTSEVQDLMTAASFIMEPFETDDLKIVLSVLKVSDDGTVTVATSRAHGTSPLPTGSNPPVDVPGGIRIPKTDLILAQVDYSLATPFSTLWPVLTVRNRFEFSKYYFARPRRSKNVVID